MGYRRSYRKRVKRSFPKSRPRLTDYAHWSDLNIYQAVLPLASQQAFDFTFRKKMHRKYTAKHRPFKSKHMLRPILSVLKPKSARLGVPRCKDLERRVRRDYFSFANSPQGSGVGKRVPNAKRGERFTVKDCR